MTSGITGAPRGKRFTLVLLVVTILHVASADAAPDRVSNFVNEYLKKNQIPGCAVMVRHDGKVVLCQGYGVTNVEHGVRVTSQTVFQSGSIGKQFTAMAIMMLIEDQKLALEDPISNYWTCRKTGLPFASGICLPTLPGSAIILKVSRCSGIILRMSCSR